jgi:hypothetical protein
MPTKKQYHATVRALLEFNDGLWRGVNDLLPALLPAPEAYAFGFGTEEEKTMTRRQTCSYRMAPCNQGQKNQDN